MRLLALVPLIALACNGGGPSDGPTDTDVDFPGPVVEADCTAYTYRDDPTIYNCDLLDYCDYTAASVPARLACCECDPTLCVPPPGTECPIEEGQPTPPPPPPPLEQQESCMTCHNGAEAGAAPYSGPGLTNPHPFGVGANAITCSQCHGGDPEGMTRSEAHVSSPWPQNVNYFENNPGAYFNFLTKTGVDKMPDWTNPTTGETHTGYQWLQFMNPGDTRVLTQPGATSCNTCHNEQVVRVSRYPINTQVGFYSATNYTMGVDNIFGDDNYENTAADYAFRAVEDPGFAGPTVAADLGRVNQLAEYPEVAQYPEGEFPNGGEIFQSQILAAELDNDIHDGTVAPYAVNQIRAGQDLLKLVQTVIASNCGDCHLGSMGANNRYADFRSSGCTSCHMEYSYDGRTLSTDPNVNREEPANPDAILFGERPHIKNHRIRNVSRVIPGGGFISGVTDRACVGCHQGSNRTVLQYWGIRMDQNKDVVNQTQYPANIDADQFTTTEFDTRLYDPIINNNTFNGRDFEQHLLEEDYDNDGADDTPPDVHYEAGMGCIDCHGNGDMHGGQTLEDGTVVGSGIMSHQSQATYIMCTSCHGSTDDPPETTPCVNYDGVTADCAVDRVGAPVRNVERRPAEGGGFQWVLTSRVSGQEIYVPTVGDVIDFDRQARDLNGQPVYNANAAYAMGRINGTARDGDGIGPIQENPLYGVNGFSHDDSVACVACHATWTNNCIGCHLHGEYNADPEEYFFSNTTGERIVIDFEALFTYQSPVMKYMTVGYDGKITQGQPGMKMFFRYQDFQGNFSNVFAFTDRNQNGNVPDLNGRNTFPGLAHNKIQPHSIGGKYRANDVEGTSACAVCHINVDTLAGDSDNDGVANQVEYEQWINDYLNNNDFANLDFDLLQQVIGLNTGNQLNHPIFVAMNAGLGTGLFAFDANGCPSNPLDDNANRFFCDGTAPQDNFNNTAGANIVYDLDRTVQFDGVSNVSSSQPIRLDNPFDPLPDFRVGAEKPGLAGPLGRNIVGRLTGINNGAFDANQVILLDTWVDPEGQPQGELQNLIQ